MPPVDSRRAVLSSLDATFSLCGSLPMCTVSRVVSVTHCAIYMMDPSVCARVRVHVCFQCLMKRDSLCRGPSRQPPGVSPPAWTDCTFNTGLRMHVHAHLTQLLCSCEHTHTCVHVYVRNEIRVLASPFLSAGNKNIECPPDPFIERES